ncbi:hypothetical protein C0J52_27400 [Blattella germanica]|nr:hypothetical protein C0J52_27400 [Blattella germanica]
MEDTTKWLVPNEQNPEKCSVRLYKLLGKRHRFINSSRFFHTPNPTYLKTGRWCKNCPVGANQLPKWMKMSAEKRDWTRKGKKITNHSSRSTAISQMTHAGVQEQEVIKITGHASSSLKPYLQMNQEHHKL